MTRRKFVGAAARTMQSSTVSISCSDFIMADRSLVPVVRAQDLAKPGAGLVYLKEGDDEHLYGLGSTFTSQLQPRFVVRLPKSLNFATADVVEVVDDTCVKIKKPFGEKARDALLAAGKRIQTGRLADFSEQPKSGIKAKGLEYKCLPYVDQTRVS